MSRLSYGCCEASSFKAMGFGIRDTHIGSVLWKLASITSRMEVLIGGLSSHKPS